MGFNDSIVVDPDVVEEKNTIGQGYHERDIGKPKVEAIRRLGLRTKGIQDVFRPKHLVGGGPAVFSCTDSMAARKEVFETFVTGSLVGLLLDARIGGGGMRILWASKSEPESVEHYGSTLYAQGEAYGAGCSDELQFWVGNVAAGLLVGILESWLASELAKEKMDMSCDRMFVPRLIVGWDMNRKDNGGPIDLHA